MKKIIALISLFMHPFLLYSSIKEIPIDTNDLKDFKTLMYCSYKITNNGKYIAYNKEISISYRSASNLIIFKAVKGNWQMSIDSVNGPLQLTENSKYAIFSKIDKTLYILKLGTTQIERFYNVSEYQNFTKNGKTFIAYKLAGSNDLRIVNLDDKTENTFSNVVSYQYSLTSNKIVLIANEDGENCIYLSDLEKSYNNKVWKGNSKVESLILNHTGNLFSFSIDSSIWYCNIEKPWICEKFKIPMNQDFFGLTHPIPISFSPKDHLLFFSLTKPLPQLTNLKFPNIYSYLDGAFDMEAEPSPSKYICCYDFRLKEFTRIEHDDDEIGNTSLDENKILVLNRKASGAEFYWNKKSLLNSFVLEINTKKRTNINFVYGNNILSPSGNFVIGSNDYLGDLFCNNIVNGMVKNLTSNLPIPLIDNLAESPQSKNSRSIKFLRFTSNHDEIIVKDHYDLWLINCVNGSDPFSLTNGFGRRNHIIFRLIDNNISFNKNGEIILSAFNEQTKASGFYKIKFGEKKDPELLTMGAFTYKEIEKAEDKNIWIVKRMSATEAPNFFSTSDFKDFKALTDVRPERKFKWFSTEMISYTTKKGIVCQAILYKPGNFDSSRKYPVLFNFYEHESYKLNEFLVPDFTSTYYFNIPLMLSRGYMVCVPDIHFTLGQTALSIVDCVEGAVDYISRFRFVDTSHLGASGGSFGGYGVNCLAAFSTRFKAVASISGISDLISGYGNVPGLRDEEYENRQLRMGVSLSSDPERYLKNSPVAFAKNVKSSVLIVITKKDYNVNIQQGIEWFISLRREGRPVWMIKYNGNEISHGVDNLEDQKDLYVRMNQFFDHYLKSSPAPQWMTEGISNKETLLRNGYEYNVDIKIPPRGLLKDSI